MLWMRGHNVPVVRNTEERSDHGGHVTHCITPPRREDTKELLLA